MASTNRVALTSCVCQILHSLPQPVEPERPAKAAVPVPAAQTQSQAPRELVWVPAEEGRQRMQPAKLAVYKMLIEDVGLQCLALQILPPHRLVIHLVFNSCSCTSRWWFSC